ncbi:MAG: hypothetical protein AAF798_04475 [Bacteroidota bacterium]
MRLIFFLFILINIIPLSSQSIHKLEYDLESASTEKQVLQVRFQLTQAYLKAKNYEKAEANGKLTHQLAKELGQTRKAGYAALFLAKANAGMATKDRKKKQRYQSKMKTWLQSAQNLGKQSKDVALVVSATNLQCELAAKARDYRKAYQYAKNTLDFMAQNKALTSPDNQYKTILLLRQQVENLTFQRDSLKWEIENY